jgi:hypothetical protein
MTQAQSDAGYADYVRNQKEHDKVVVENLKKAINNPTPLNQFLVGNLTPSTEKAATYDDGKLPLAWLPWDAVRAMNEVQQYGHQKYKDFNNYRKGMEVSRNLSCALRHISEYLDGIDLDYESGKNHLAHAMCRVAFVLQNIHDGTAIDDRYKKGPAHNKPPQP